MRIINGRVVLQLRVGHLKPNSLQCFVRETSMITVARIHSAKLSAVVVEIAIKAVAWQHTNGNNDSCSRCSYSGRRCSGGDAISMATPELCF